MANSEDGIGLQLTSDALDLVTSKLAIFKKFKDVCVRKKDSSRNFAVRECQNDDLYARVVKPQLGRVFFFSMTWAGHKVKYNDLFSDVGVFSLFVDSLAKLQFGHRSLATANRRRKRSRKGRKKKTHGVLDAPLKNGASSLSKKKRQRSKGGKRTRVLRLAAIAAGISQHKPVWKQQQYAPLAAEMRKDPQAAVPGFFKMLEVELPSESDLGMSEELRALFKLS